MLPDGHTGRHEWTRDDELELEFVPLEEDQPK
jgi:hypothetical protein